MLRSMMILSLITSTYGAACPSANGVVCGGHGTCSPNGDDNICICDRGYGGVNCLATGCSDPLCGGHGTCQDPAITPGIEGNMAFCLCDGGWSGDDCTTESGDCTPGCVDGRGVCEHGSCKCTSEYAGPTCNELACGPEQKCSDHGTCDQSAALLQFKCTCTEGWAGRACDTSSLPCSDPACGGNGQCDNVQGVCVCNKGFAGHDCTKPSCPNDCGLAENKGRCIDSARCECNAGFAGEGCAYKDCPNKCGGHGQCALNIDPNLEGICKCDAGFTGQDCLAEPCPNACSAHGECKDTGDGHGKICRCASGFTGTDCSECDPDIHCSKHGTCVFDNNKPLCECFGGFSTTDCSLAACPLGQAPGKEKAVCSGQGECTRDSDSGQYQCLCDPGFGTVDCHANCTRGILADGTTSKKVCGGHGYCADTQNFAEDGYGAGSCFCEEGWTGEACTEGACPKTVPMDSANGIRRMCGGLGQGACVKSECYCRTGFAPPDCSSAECPNDCSGNGVCMDGGKCACDSGFGGDDCSEPACCDPKCNNHGECKTGRCHCEENFFGPGCADDRTPLVVAEKAEKVNTTKVCEDLKRCYGRGDCDVESKSCDCDEGFYGDFCEKKQCKKGCGGRGTCNENGVCECEEGFGGKFCERRACPNDCNGRGYCINGTCFCRAGWEGVGCTSRACKNNCNAMGVCKAGICACLNGYSNEDCSAPPCPGWAGGQQCSGHGICEKQICTCTGRHEDPFDEPMWSGEDCATLTCPSGIPGKVNACSGHGSCDEGVCKCANGWKGFGCHVKTCLSNCHGRGKCDESHPQHPKCLCKKGYEGEDCGFLSCSWDPILNVPKPGCHEDLQPTHGMCGSNGTCFCAANYTGKYCEKPACRTCRPLDHCLNSCNNVGVCENGKCACNVGFSGEDCSTKTTEVATPEAPASLEPPASPESPASLLETKTKKTIPLSRLVMSDDRRVACLPGCNERHENDDSERWLCMSNCVERAIDRRTAPSSLLQ